MLQQLREEVLEANLALVRHGLVVLTWGNVSGRDAETGLVVIKPSGLAYGRMKASDMVVVSPNGEVVEGYLRPSTDTPTHLALYEGMPGIGGVVHTHSTWATAWAQARRAVPVLGTTHADMCPGPVGVTRHLSGAEVAGGYEAATGRVVLEEVGGRSPGEVPAVLVAGHGPFCWASSAQAAVEVAVTLEQVAKMAWLTVGLGPSTEEVALPAYLVEQHFNRKHGPGAYYGQEGHR